MIAHIAASDIICDAANAVVTRIMQDNFRSMSETCVIAVCVAFWENTLSVLRRDF